MAKTNTYKVAFKEFERDIKVLAGMIRKSQKKYAYIYPIKRGGLIIALRLSHLLDIPITYLAYQYRMFFPGNTLIVDDVNDTSRTLEPYMRQGYDTAVLHRKDTACFETTYVVRTINKWICYWWEQK